MKVRRRNNKQIYNPLTMGTAANRTIIAPNRKTRRALKKMKQPFIDIRELL